MIEIRQGRKHPDDRIVIINGHWVEFPELVEWFMIYMQNEENMFPSSKGYDGAMRLYYFLSDCIDAGGVTDELLQEYKLGDYRPKNMKIDRFKNYVNVNSTMTDFITTDLASKMRSGINVAGEITKLGDKRTVNLKQGGSVDVVDAILSDESGDITLALWGDDINKVQIGSKVKVLNGYTNEFKGQVSLTKGKFGQLEVE